MACKLLSSLLIFCSLWLSLGCEQEQMESALPSPKANQQGISLTQATFNIKLILSSRDTVPPPWQLIRFGNFTPRPAFDGPSDEIHVQTESRGADGDRYGMTLYVGDHGIWIVGNGGAGYITAWDHYRIGQEVIDQNPARCLVVDGNFNALNHFYEPVEPFYLSDNFLVASAETFRCDSGKVVCYYLVDLREAKSCRDSSFEGCGLNISRYLVFLHHNSEEPSLYYMPDNEHPGEFIVRLHFAKSEDSRRALILGCKLLKSNYWDQPEIPYMRLECEPNAALPNSVRLPFQ